MYVKEKQQWEVIFSENVYWACENKIILRANHQFMSYEVLIKLLQEVDDNSKWF